MLVVPFRSSRPHRTAPVLLLSFRSYYAVQGETPPGHLSLETNSDQHLHPLSLLLSDAWILVFVQ